jgi:hypothetical protein
MADMGNSSRAKDGIDERLENQGRSVSGCKRSHLLASERVVSPASSVST